MKIGILLYILMFSTVNLLAQNWEELNSKALDLFHKGDYINALVTGEKARQQATSEFGPEHEYYATSLTNLASFYYANGNYESALSLYNEASGILLKAIGSQDPIYATLLNNLAETYKSIGNYKAAKPLYTKAKIIMLQIFGRENQDYATIENNLGMLYMVEKNYTAALPLIEESKNIRLHILGNKHPDYVQSLNDLATLQMETKNYNAALPLLEEAKVITLQTAGDKSFEYARILHNIANFHRDTGNYNYAGSLYTEAREITLHSVGNKHPQYGITTKSLAGLLMEMSKYEQALLLYKEISDIKLQTVGSEHPDYIESLNNLAAVYQTMGNYEEAFLLYKNSFKKFGNSSSINSPEYITLINNLGSFYLLTGNYEEALPLLKNAITLSKEVFGIKSHEYATSLNNLAEVYQELGNLEDAFPLLKESQEIIIQISGSQSSEYASSLNNLALLYSKMGKYDEAVNAFEKVVHLYRKISGNQTPDYARSLNNLAGCYQLMREYDSSLPLSVEALNIMLTVYGKYHPNYATSLNTLASLFESMGNYENALPLYKESLNIRLKMLGKNNTYFSSSLHNLALFYYKRNDLDSCKYYLIESIDVTKAQFEILDILSERQKTLFLQKNKNEFNIFYSIAMKIFDYDKSISSILLNSQLYTQGLLLSSTKKIKETIQSSDNQQLIDQYNEYVQGKSNLARIYSLTTDEIKINKINVDSLEKVSENQEQELAKKTKVFKDYLNKRNYKWTNIRDKLKPNEAAVSILRFPYYNREWTDTIMYAALLITSETKESPQLVVLKNGPDFEQKFLTQYNSSILPGIPDADNSKYNPTCFHAFWEEIDKEIGNRNVVYLCPDGVYHLINLNTLQYPDGRYLYEKKDIVILSSLMDLLEEEIPEFSSKKALLVGAPDYSLDTKSHNKLAANLADNGSGGGSYALTRDFRNYSMKGLPGTKIEVDNINKLLGEKKWRVQCLTGGDAMEESVKSAKNPRVLHIATHGFFSNNVYFNNPKQLTTSLFFGQNPIKALDNPMLRSGLMFSGSQNTLNGEYDPMSLMDDGILTGYEAMNLNLDSTELVILSACETGLGEIRDGEGVFGLQRAFKLAGAKNIIMSLWKVDDNATQLLMKKFYEFWLAGNSKREAFRMAQDHLRKETAYKDPYYWGGFVYIGMDKPQGNRGIAGLNDLLQKLPEAKQQYIWFLLLILPIGLLIRFRKKIFK
jgi:CHAT domain-containing protein/Flp pilus assembly protein TadD